MQYGQMIRAAFKFSLENVVMQYCSNIHYLLNMYRVILI